MFLQVARLSILLAEQEKNFSYLAQILGPTLAWERWLRTYPNRECDIRVSGHSLSA